MSVHKQILDPLSTLCKIGLLSFYENGSKISITDNIIEIQRSESKQWLIRTYRGDSKEQISLLYNPIIKSIQWYIFQEQRNINLVNKEKINAIKNIMEFTIQGLRKLKETYKDGNVILTIQFLINNLKIAISDKPDYELFEDYNDNITFEDNGILNYEKIKEIWNIDTIHSISTQFQLCKKNVNNQDELNNMLESLYLMLRNTDTKFKKLVIDMNSTL